MVGDGIGESLDAGVVFCIIGDVFAFGQDAATEINVLVVEFAHLPPFSLL